MAGRPTVLDDEMRRKIDEAAQLGCSVEEIALWCGVWRSTVYRWMKEDEDLKDRIEELRERPVMKARQTIVKSLDNPADARWYLERKKKQEFSERIEQTGADGKELNPVSAEAEARARAFDEWYKSKLQD